MAIGLGSAMISYFVAEELDRKKFYDPYTGAVIGSLVFMGSLFVPPYGAIPAGLGMGLAIYGLRNMTRSARIVLNEYGGPVYVLAESERGKVYQLGPYSTETPYGIDGLAIPSVKNAVFKVPNGVKIVINHLGCINILGPVARAVAGIRGAGWVTENEARCRGWLSDGHWSELFKVLKRS